MSDAPPELPPTQPSNWLRRELPLLLVLLAIAGGLRVVRIGFDSLTFDEIWHLELSTGRGSPHVRNPWDQLIPSSPAVTSLAGAPGWRAVWTNMDFVVHPPLYCTLLGIWRTAFGTSDAAARALSIALSCGAISLLFLIVRQTQSLTAAWWACLLLAVAPTQVWLAQEVRGYQLLQLLSLGAALALIRRERLPTLPNAVALGACLLGMMLTHYFAIGIAAAIGVYALIRFRGRMLATTLLIFGSSALVYAIVWLPFLWQQRAYFTGTADPWLVESDPNHLVLTLQRLASCGWMLLVNENLGSWLSRLSIVVLLAPLLLLRRRPDLLIWYLWLAGTVGFLLGLDLLRGTAHLKFERYVSPATAAVVVLVVAALLRWTSHIGPAVLVIACLACSGVAYRSTEPDWRTLGAWIDQHVAADEPILFHAGVRPQWYVEILDLGSSHYSRQFPRPVVRLSKAADVQLLRSLNARTAWLISGPMKREDIGEILSGATVMGEPDFVPDLAMCVRVSLPTAQ